MRAAAGWSRLSGVGSASAAATSIAGELLRFDAERWWWPWLQRSPASSFPYLPQRGGACSAEAGARASGSKTAAEETERRQ